MKTLQHFFYPGILSLVFLISMAAIEGCNKYNGESNNTTTSVLLDSIISDEGAWPHMSIKYIYDNEERVIEERISHDDTLKTRRTYEYQGSNIVPYKMDSYNGTSTSPVFVSSFLYNAAGQKNYDSTYATPGSPYTGYMIAKLDYSVAGRISVRQHQHPANNYFNDTVFLNNGNIDSVKTNLYGNNTWVFGSFTNKLNVFKNLSISSCRFYSPTPGYPGLMFTGYSYQTVQDIILEYNNVNHFGVFTLTGSLASTQYEYQYNSSNLPVTLKKTTTAPGYLWVTQMRFVYK